MAHGAKQDDFVRGIMAELGQHMDSTHPRSHQRRRPAVSRLHIISLNNNELPDVSTAGTPVSPMSASSEGRTIGNTAIGIDEPFLKLVKTRAGSPKEKAASMPRSLPSVQQQKGRGSDRKRHLHQTKRKSLGRCSPDLKHSQKHSSDMLHVSALSNIATRVASLKQWIEFDSSENFRNLALRGVYDIEEHLAPMHSAFGTVFEELVKMCKLLSSPLGDFLQHVWDDYVQLLYEALEERLHKSTLHGHREGMVSSVSSMISGSMSISEAGLYEEPQVLSEQQSQVLMEQGMQKQNQKGKSKIASTLQQERPSMRKHSSLPLIPSLSNQASSLPGPPETQLTAVTPSSQKRHHHYHKHHHHHHNHHNDNNKAAGTNGNGDWRDGDIIESVPINIRKSMRQMSEHTVSFARLRQVMFGKTRAKELAADAERRGKHQISILGKMSNEDTSESKSTQGAITWKPPMTPAEKVLQLQSKRKAAIMLQSAFRARRARKKLHVQRLRSLMEITQFEFSEKMQATLEMKDGSSVPPPDLNSQECCAIVEHGLWESRRFVRDLTMDWWNKEKQDDQKQIAEDVQRRMDREFRFEAVETLQSMCDEMIDFIQMTDSSKDLSKEVLEEIISSTDTGRSAKEPKERWQHLERSSQLLGGCLRDISIAYTRRKANVKTQSTSTVGTFEELARAWNVAESLRAQQELKAHKENTAKPSSKKRGRTKNNKRSHHGDDSRGHSKDKSLQSGPMLPVSLQQFVTMDPEEGRPMRKETVLAFVEEIYWEKMLYDEVDDREGHPRHGLAEFVHDHLFRKYGLRSLADHHLYNLVASLRIHSEEGRIRTFMRYLGMPEAKKKPLPRDALDFMLYMMAFLHSMTHNGKPLVKAQNNNGAPQSIPVISATSIVPVVVSVLVQNGPPLIKQLMIDPLKMMSRLRGEINQAAVHNKIDYDVLLELLVVEFEWVWAQLSEHLRSIFIRGDLNADGVLTLDEFTEILQTVSPGVSDNRIHRMFKAALEATQRNGQDADLGVNSISPEAFVTVSHKFGFLSGDHRTYMPPRPLTRRDSMNTQHESVDGLRVLNHADDSTTLDEEDEDSSSDKVSRNVGPGTEDGHDVSITRLNAARRSNFALDEVVEGSAPHSNKEWGQQGETRKQRVKLARRNSMIHQSAHELVLGKVQALLAKASAQFGEKHPKVAETLFIMRAYKRNTTDRTSFHRLTRVTQALAELLEEAEKIDNADLIMGRDATMLLQQQTAEKNQSDEDSEDTNEEEDEISGGENENEKDAGGSIVVVVENAAELDI